MMTSAGDSALPCDLPPSTFGVQLIRELSAVIDAVSIVFFVLVLMGGSILMVSGLSASYDSRPTSSDSSSLPDGRSVAATGLGNAGKSWWSDRGLVKRLVRFEGHGCPPFSNQGRNQGTVSRSKGGFVRDFWCVYFPSFHYNRASRADAHTSSSKKGHARLGWAGRGQPATTGTRSYSLLLRRGPFSHLDTTDAYLLWSYVLPCLAQYPTLACLRNTRSLHLGQPVAGRSIQEIYSHAFPKLCNAMSFLPHEPNRFTVKVDLPLILHTTQFH